VTQSVEASPDILLDTERLFIDVDGLGLRFVTLRVRDSGILLSLGWNSMYELEA
jgi:hypothetical protein